MKFSASPFCWWCKYAVALGISVTAISLVLQWFKTDVIHYYLRTSNSEIPIPYAIVTFIKDEADILNYWIDYHSKIVGPTNIVVLDNFSGAPSLEILKKWEILGVHVEYNVSDYRTKGVKQFKAFKDHFPWLDLAIPLDVDEFLVHYQQNVPIFNAKLVQQQLEKFRIMPDHKFACLALVQYHSDCEVPLNSTFADEQTLRVHIYPPQWSKKIYKMKFLTWLDHGGHFGKLDHPKGNKVCSDGMNKLGLVHFHHRSPLIKLRRAVNELVAMGYIDAVQNIELLTTKEFLLPYESKLLELRKNTTFGKHKIDEVIRYIQHGPQALMMECTELVRLNEPMAQLLAKA